VTRYSDVLDVDAIFVEDAMIAKIESYYFTNRYELSIVIFSTPVTVT